MPFPFKEVIERLKEFYMSDVPVVTRIANERHDPFLVLIGCLLSLRTKDETTDKAMERLMKRARTPREAAVDPHREVEKIIYPVGFYMGEVASYQRESREPSSKNTTTSCPIPWTSCSPSRAWDGKRPIS